MRESIFRSPLTCLLLLGSTLTSAAVATVPSGEGWQRLETASFIVLSNLDETATKEIGLDLERLRAVLAEIFPRVEFDSPLDTLIYVFKDHGSFEPYSLAGGQSAYFAPHKHANFAAVVGSRPDEALPVLYRQYLHDLVDHNVPQVPLWFRHGLAEIFSTFQADAALARVALPLGGADGLGLAGSERLPVPDVLSLETLPSDGAGMSAFVQGSWALVHYLLVDDAERFAATRRYLAELNENPTSQITLTEVLGVDPLALEASVEAYLQRSPLPHREVPVPAGAPREAALTPLDPPATLFHLGDLLIHTRPDRSAAARAHFQASLEQAPDFAPSIAGLGLVSELAGDPTTAESYYRQALENLPDAFRLQVLFGEIELELLGRRRPQTPEEQTRLDRAVAAFQKSVELRPGYGEGWALLGYAYNLQARPSVEAVPTLERAYEMLPARGDVAYNLFLGYARAGERQKAIDLVATAQARGVPEERLAPARQTLLQLDFQHAVALVREKQYDQAAVLLEKIAAEADDASLRQQAADLLAQLER